MSVTVKVIKDRYTEDPIKISCVAWRKMCKEETETMYIIPLENRFMNLMKYRQTLKME